MSKEHPHQTLGEGMLELREVTKRVGKVDHIKSTTLTLKPGYFNVLLGATGSGKTSLIKLMAGLDPVHRGKIFLGGKDVTLESTQKRNVSLVHQFFVNYPHMNVFENIASPLRVARKTESEIKEKVEEAADLLQLGPMLSRFPGELSGGQQQRTALARAIAKESRVVFLDEPLANLDYKLREELREQLPGLFKDRGCVVVYATSEPEEALMLGGKTALIDDGRVTQFGTTSEIYRNPQNFAAAKVFSNPPINAVRITKAGENAELDGEVTWKLNGPSLDLPDGHYTMAIHPHQISPFRQRESDAELRGQVLVTELTGSESSAHFQFAGNIWVSLASGIHPYSVGEPHNFYLNPANCYFFTPDGNRAVTSGTD